MRFSDPFPRGEPCVLPGPCAALSPLPAIFKTGIGGVPVHGRELRILSFVMGSGGAGVFHMQGLPSNSSLLYTTWIILSSLKTIARAYSVVAAGFTGCGKTYQPVILRSQQATKDLCICLKPKLPGSFAALRMTDCKRFSAACSARHCGISTRCPPKGGLYNWGD